MSHIYPNMLLISHILWRHFGSDNVFNMELAYIHVYMWTVFKLLFYSLEKYICLQNMFL